MTVVEHERAVTRPCEKSRLDQRAEHCLAGSLIEQPQPACLLRRESQTRHLQELSTHAPDDILQSQAFLLHE
jgi:hypothetical protein